MTASNPTKAILLTLAFAAGACAEADAETKPALPPKPVKRTTPLPERLVETPAADAARQGLRITGRTRPNRESALSTTTSGRVADVRFQVGDYVKAGHLMVRLDGTQARLSVDASKAALQTARAQADGAERERARLEKAGPRGAVPKADVDRAVTAHEMAKAQTSQAEAALALAEDRVGDTVIRAPFSGLVLARSANEGEWVNTMGGGVVARLADIDPLEVALEAPEHLLGKIVVGAEMEVHFAATGQTVTAEVRRVVSAVDPVKRSFEVVVEVPNPDREYAPGLFAEAQLVPEATP